MSRIYQNCSLQVGSELSLDEKASHHLAKVLRVAIQEKITLFNGQGGEFEAVVIAIDKKTVRVNLIKFIDKERESPIHICLAQGIARGEKMDFIIQKAVELGVNCIVPLNTERSNVKLNQEREAKRLQHWQSIIISACEQSGRNHLPQLMAPMRLSQWLEQAKYDYQFVLSPHVNTKLSSIKIVAQQSLSLLIGSEGGLSEKEIALAQQQGFITLNLGPRVLRTETASLAALAVIQSNFGDLQ